MARRTFHALSSQQISWLTLTGTPRGDMLPDTIRLFGAAGNAATCRFLTSVVGSAVRCRPSRGVTVGAGCSQVGLRHVPSVVLLPARGLRRCVFITLQGRRGFGRCGFHTSRRKFAFVPCRRNGRDRRSKNDVYTLRICSCSSRRRSGDDDRSSATAGSPLTCSDCPALCVGWSLAGLATASSSRRSSATKRC